MFQLISIIESLIKVKGITAKEYGILIGMKKSPISDWKSGKSKPTLDQVIKTCEIFELTPNQLLGYNTEYDLEYRELIKQYKLHDESIRSSVRKLLDMETEGESYNSKIG